MICHRHNHWRLRFGEVAQLESAILQLGGILDCGRMLLLQLLGGVSIRIALARRLQLGC